MPGRPAPTAPGVTSLHAIRQGHLLERRTRFGGFLPLSNGASMPRFFFNTTCADRAVTDVAGEDCRTLEEARTRHGSWHYDYHGSE